MPVQGTITIRVDDPTLDLTRELVVISAANLRKADLLGGSDPYAVVCWDGQRCDFDCFSTDLRPILMHQAPACIMYYALCIAGLV